MACATVPFLPPLPSPTPAIDPVLTPTRRSDGAHPEVKCPRTAATAGGVITDGDRTPVTERNIESKGSISQHNLTLSDIRAGNGVLQCFPSRNDSATNAKTIHFKSWNKPIDASSPESAGKPFSARRVGKLQDLRQAIKEGKTRQLLRTNAIWVKALLPEVERHRDALRARQNSTTLVFPYQSRFISDGLSQEPQVGRSPLPALLVGWVAMAWSVQKKPLYGSRKELARLLGCSVGSVERWTRLLCSWDWLVPKTHYKPRAGGGYTQQANSYIPGLLLHAALGAERDDRARRAGKEGALRALRPVVSSLRSEREQNPSRDRAPVRARVDGAPAVPAAAASGGPTARLTASGSATPALEALEPAGSACGEAGEGKGIALPAASGDPEELAVAAITRPSPRGLRGERAAAIAELEELTPDETRRAALQLMLAFAGGGQ